MKKFISGSIIDDDKILLEVKDDAALFYYEKQVEYFNFRRDLVKKGEREEDGETLGPFYWIPVFNWDEQVKDHLLRKSWVTQEMINYIEKNINK